MNTGKIFPGADERTPSKSQYFSWINNTNEGATEFQTQINLEFFRWLRETWGLVLDIFAFDAGAIDGAKYYGSMESERFHRQFPHGFGDLAALAAEIDCRFGLWGGPDGFGESEAEGGARKEMMVSLCRDFGFALFKMDAVCGQLRPEKWQLFAEMMAECRQYVPDFILLNHRLELGEGAAHATTTLFEGAETYIDVHMANAVTAPHNRAVALARGLPPSLTRLTEDHGVCLSSCLDYWEDDLVLQAFNRCLILAPEIYGNPWLLRDDEYPRLARIFNLHRRYREILVDALPLDEASFGPHALARGDGNTRLITMRNLTWEPAWREVLLGESIGLRDSGSKVHVRRYHPHERIYGDFAYGERVSVEVLPFRSLLLLVTTQPAPEPAVYGCDFDVVNDKEVCLLGLPGTVANISLADGAERRITFPGELLKEGYHRKLGDLAPVPVPSDARSLYEATCFAADSNALEYRELERSGSTAYPTVRAAREAFFGQDLFKQRYGVDQYLFDDSPETAFATSRRWGDQRIRGGSLRLDFGEDILVDRVVFEVRSEYDLQPFKSQENVVAWISSDLVDWQQVYVWANPSLELCLPSGTRCRYITFEGCPDKVVSVRGYSNGHALIRTKWCASNLLAPWSLTSATQAWQHEFVLGEAEPGSYLAIAIEGVHGIEGAYAALKVGERYVGAPRRAPSFPSNTWECPVRAVDRSYTYYVPVTPGMLHVPIQAVVLGLGAKKWPWEPAVSVQLDLRPHIWLTAYPIPYARQLVTIS